MDMYLIHLYHGGVLYQGHPAFYPRPYKLDPKSHASFKVRTRKEENSGTGSKIESFCDKISSDFKNKLKHVKGSRVRLLLKSYVLTRPEKARKCSLIMTIDDTNAFQEMQFWNVFSWLEFIIAILEISATVMHA
ncbi:hypothetical protein VNO77_34414 [Canavalia gladiata]|uniref:Uncharacterized protein n=1 Tax=Canavalia gladiata TaxID=3824 RepID=A0AAN9KDJ5_CANGL